MPNNNPSNSMKFRTKIVMTAVFMMLFAGVAVNFFKISVLDNKKYQEMANDQHFGSITISAHRGSIYDAKGTPMAKSASVYKVFLDPTRFREDMTELQKRIDKRNADKASGSYTPKYDEKGNEINQLPQSAETLRDELVSLLSAKLGITAEKVRKAMEEKTQYSVLQDQVEKPVAYELLAFFNKYGFISLAVEEDTKRYYPQNEVAASVIGFTNADGNGLYGIESYYDEYLAGVDGRTISAKDSNGNELPYRYSKTYEPKNGNDVYLTIDSNIQYMLEKHLEEMNTEFDVANRSCAILMNAKTGAVYGMATYPGFDLNQPYKIYDPIVAARINTINNEDEKKKKIKVAQETQWRNKCITENYEPGSVFKVITSAAAIEDNLVNFDKKEFYCPGFIEVPGALKPIHCHKREGHNAQTFQEALTHSCNPAFITLGQRLGVERFCYYFDAFGLRERTGIDLPAEISGYNKNESNMSTVDLASSAYGQCETITPLEMITSYCAAINGGYLLEPYVVDKVVDEDGNIVFKNERTVKRQVVSEDTSAKMCDALKHVVDDNNGGNVAIKGYSIGGKSGTSQRLSIASDILASDEDTEIEKSEYASSYVCFTPAEDPEIILLVMADLPDKTKEYYGSKVAVPTAREILTDVLPYIGMTPNYSDEELKSLDVKVPLLEGALDDVKATLDGLGLTYEVVGNGVEVVAQSPITGTPVAKGGCVYLYTELGSEMEMTEVPDLMGLSPQMANESLAYMGLNFVARGASVNRADAAVTDQSYQKGTKVPKGTTIELEFTVNETSD